MIPDMMTVGPIPSENRLPVSVIAVIPTAAMPVIAVLMRIARKFAVVANPEVETAATIRTQTMSRGRA